MTNSVPDRWLEYKAYGDVIKGTRILAFKAPLKESISKNLKPDQQFTTAILLQEFPQLKYIVDLTNTYRYYDKKEFTDVGVKYEKIALPGRTIPPMDIIMKFFKVMDDFTATCGEGELIGVHCTHGVNRTGYLICRYLIQQLGWEFRESVKAFGEARGYPVERNIYLDALKEIQPGDRIETSKINLSQISTPATGRKRIRLRKTRVVYPSGSTLSAMRRNFANGRPFPSQRFGPPPAFGPIPPPPPHGMLDWPLPPPPMGPPPPPPPYGPRPFRYGPPPARPPLTPPHGPGFPHPGFPPRLPGPPRMTGPPILPAGPVARLPPPKIPPPFDLPLPPPPSSSRTSKLQKKKQQVRNGIAERSVNIRMRRNGPVSVTPKKEQDFTADTFEENLTTTTSRKHTKRSFNQSK
ncbi:RNA/RNP complex-1-interacting phosphatase [Pseudomyrmex gracilis]|uniref:RNA/RNP complex-1-interacting phosphatase n=1 Tax=Pseudomyrmex gracilis TaxID=219809 RepID=UPI000994F6BD|nr:RNA/RNP complex-1-interacting phosphatase [Pseudomyrmex gracilis]